LLRIVAIALVLGHRERDASEPHPRNVELSFALDPASLIDPCALLLAHKSNND